MLDVKTKRPPDAIRASSGTLGSGFATNGRFEIAGQRTEELSLRFSL
jgi:hypothetical protein